MQLAGVAALSPAAGSAAPTEWPLELGGDHPKICVGLPSTADEATLRQWRQVGVNHVLMGGPRMQPWTESALREIMDRFRSGGIEVINMMIGGRPCCRRRYRPRWVSDQPAA